jgi:topoisomerase-4 subunit A
LWVGSIKKLKFDIDFASLIKGRASKRDLASKYPIKKIEIKRKGISTAKKSVVDDTVQRLNVDARVIRNSDPMIKF